MSRYPPSSDYRGPRDRSRSPPRFTDRRPSNASNFDSRPPAPPRAATDLPRSRPPFDGSRPPLNPGPGSAGNPRPAYSSLRDAPPLGSGDGGRSYREREYDRRDRPPSPRDRSPPRAFKDTRDYPPRDGEPSRARRDSRDGHLPLGAGSLDTQPYPSAGPARNFAARRGARVARGGRSNFDDRDLFRRDRSPPPTWARDSSRDSRPSDRRDDRRFERREDDRRPSEWSDREREADRARRDSLPSKPDSRPGLDSAPLGNASYQPSQAAHVNPARLALIENTAPEPAVRRHSVQLDRPTSRDGRRDQPETPAYLSGRAETTADRYGSRGSSPPTQAPPVPAFTLSFAPTAAATASQAATLNTGTKSTAESKPTSAALTTSTQPTGSAANDEKSEPPTTAPTAPRLPPAAPKAQLVSPPPAAAPKAPRALENEEPTASARKFGLTRPGEALPVTGPFAVAPNVPRVEPRPSNAPQAPTFNPPASPIVSQIPRPIDVNPPTGPRASRVSPAQTSVSPRPPFVAPRGDAVAPAGPAVPSRALTPPPSAPSGPRNSTFSVSPKVATSSVPTAPKADRAPPIAPRAADRASLHGNRPAERLSAGTTWAPPSAPRSQPQWNQWRRPGVPVYGDKTVPAKRDVFGEEKGKFPEQATPVASANTLMRPGNYGHVGARSSITRDEIRKDDLMDIDRQTTERKPSMMAGHSAVRSFFGKPAEGEDEESSTTDNAQEPVSSSEDDDSDLENDIALFNAKFEREKRNLEAQMVNLSSRQYRATTPLENLARLARISTRDMETHKEQREHAMDVQHSPVARRHHVLPPTRHSSDSAEVPDVVTPKDEVEHRVAIRSSDDSSEGIRRVRRVTPEPVHLPYLLKNVHSPLEEGGVFAESLKRHDESIAEILDGIEEDTQAEEDLAAEIEDQFAVEYRKWREECEDLDRLREEQEKLERQQSLEPRLEMDAPLAPPATLMFQGRRAYKSSSEYEIEMVLKQSEETARIEQERQDREARKNQADMEKEALIPDQFTEEQVIQCMFIDNNRYRVPETLTAVFSYEPPADNFTENEQHIFIAAFKETPKKWGEIASLLPGRTYQDCIRHYYANKWDGRFHDNRARKIKGGRRGRGGARGPRGRMGGLMADLARTEDFLGAENMSEKGRPRRAAAPTNFGEKEVEAKASLLGVSPAKKSGPGSKGDANEQAGLDKPGKRQKRNGEKPGRKSNKASQPLAALAAAPNESPGKPFTHAMHSKEELADASVLASMHAGARGNMGDVRLVYHQEGYMQQMMPPSEEGDRSKGVAPGPAVKQGASSYWSVPEQNDFKKYIGHFGRDFQAIALHMGTKTQTMIKNHYQRQVDGGNQPELERAAIEADERRARGEDMGPPPTPTPIQKRKYEGSSVPSHRPLAPHADDGEMDEGGSSQRLTTAKHASPPQYQSRPDFTTSTQNASITAARFAPSPLSTSAALSATMPPASHSRPLQHPLGSRISFLPENRSEAGAGAQNVFGYRGAQESPSRTQSSQPGRPVKDAADPSFIRNLVQERDRALQMQERHSHADRPDQFQLHSSMSRPQAQGPPATQALHNPQDRKATGLDERVSSPPRTLFSQSGLSRPLFGPAGFGPFSSNPLSSITGRSALNPSPTKREESRIGAFSSAPPAPTPAAAAPPSEPKRSNVLSLLNSEPEGPTPPKRDSLTPATQKAPSPAQQGFSTSSTMAGMSDTTGPRREPSFGQTSLPNSAFQRGSFSGPSSTPTPGSKQEVANGGGPLSQNRKPDWAAHVLGQTSQQPRPTTPTIDREGRPLYQHRSLLGSLGQPRIDPSPHSRTSSFSGPSGQSQHDPLRPTAAGQPQNTAHRSLQQHPYSGQQQGSMPTTQAQSQPHHAHATSASGPFPTFHSRTPSRNDYARQDASMAAHREREEQEMRWRQREALEGDRRREEQYRQQQEQERERERRQPLQRPSMQHSPFNGSPFGQGRIADLRGQSRIETEMAMEQERQRIQQQDADRRRQESRERERAEEVRRRQQEDSMFRRTPLGGAFGIPPPSGPRR